MGITDGADLAAAQVIEGLAQERARTTLRAQLDHPAIFPGRSHHLPAFPEVVGKGFLDINVLARLAGPDCRQRMPVIGQSDDHSVNSLVVQDPAKVHVSGDRFTPILERPAFAVKERLVHIAQGGDLYPGNLTDPGDELMPSPAHAPYCFSGPQPDYRRSEERRV